MWSQIKRRIVRRFRNSSMITGESIMNSEKYEKLQNDFFERLEHTHTIGEIKLLIQWFKEEKKNLENDKEETDESSMLDNE